MDHSDHNFSALEKLQYDLTNKTDRTPDEDELLGELKALTEIMRSIPPFQYLSVAPAAGRCPACGRPFKEPEL